MPHDGFKRVICHHKLALEIFHGILPKLVTITAKKKRGRKKKVSTALISEDDIVPPGKKVKKNIRK